MFLRLKFVDLIKLKIFREIPNFVCISFNGTEMKDFASDKVTKVTLTPGFS